MVKSMNPPMINKAAQVAELLKDIINGTLGVSEKLNEAMKTIAEGMGADGSSCYLAIDDNYIEMFASYGFSSKLNNQIALKVGEGIIGRIAKAKCTFTTANMWEDPDFLHRDGVEEEQYKGFLGVPLIRWGIAIGVLCLYKKEVYEFSNEEINAMETLAMPFTRWAASDEIRNYKSDFMRKRGISARDKFKGVSLNRGYGIGAAVVHRRRQAVTKIFAKDKEAELKRLTEAHSKMNEDLDEKFNSAKLGLGEHAEILDTYRMLAKDKGWLKRMTDHIDGGLTVEAAVERAYEDMWNRLSGTQDTYLRERLNDLRDITDRLLSYLYGDKGEPKSQDEKDIIVIAQMMGPADLMDYDYHKIRALILEDGTPTMHVAIVAKALGIPVVAKIKGIYNEIRNGEILAVDGENGVVYIDPKGKVLETIKQKIAQRQQEIKQMSALKKRVSKTLDNQKINLFINVGLDFDLEYIDSTNCNGIGLYRTEIPFMSASKMPDVTEQLSFYSKLMDKAGNRKVVFRSLDVGSDKLLPYWTFSGEENPAIGWRSIRITLDRRAILRQQLRAFIRAAKGKELNVMFPMVANLTEFNEAKETLMIEMEREKQRSNEVPNSVNTGMMIEVPSLLFQLDEILPHTDFVSIGTNDLAQFVFACDRTNNRLMYRYDVLSSPFLRILKEIIDKCNHYKVACSVCGEMASNPIEAMALLGLGYRNLSVSGASFYKVKKMARSVNTAQLSDYLNTLLKKDQRSLRSQMTAYATDHNIEIF